MPTRSCWLTKSSDTALPEAPARGASSCQAMGCEPDRLLKPAISKLSCTTSVSALLLWGHGDTGRVRPRCRGVGWGGLLSRPPPAPGRPGTRIWGKRHTFWAAPAGRDATAGAEDGGPVYHTS